MQQHPQSKAPNQSLVEPSRELSWAQNPRGLHQNNHCLRKTQPICVWAEKSFPALLLFTDDFVTSQLLHRGKPCGMQAAQRKMSYSCKPPWRRSFKFLGSLLQLIFQSFWRQSFHVPSKSKRKILKSLLLQKSRAEAEKLVFSCKFFRRPSSLLQVLSFMSRI